MLGLHLHNERNIAGARERARGLIAALSMRPSGLASAAGPEHLPGSGRLYFPTKPENPYASQTKWDARSARRNSRRAGGNGRRGPSWKRWLRFELGIKVST